MRVLAGLVVAALTIALCDGRPAPSIPTTVTATETQHAFLIRVDAALANRDPHAILGLSDLNSWLESGRSAPDPSVLTLPTSPITRRLALSETDILYADGGGREWRLSLRGDEHRGWSIVLRDRPCPVVGGMPRGQGYERVPQAEAYSSWTPLECWPLPK